MYKKLIFSTLFLLTTATHATDNYNGTIRVINKIKSPTNIPTIAYFMIMKSVKGTVEANDHSVDNITPIYRPVDFDLDGMILGNTYQTNVSPDCHFQLWMEPGWIRTVEIHSPPDDEAGYHKLITCTVVR